MKGALSARSRSNRGAPRPLLWGLRALITIGASTATAQPGDVALAIVVLTNSEPETITVQGIAFSFDGAAAGPLPWVEAWTLRRNDALLVFRRSGGSGPPTELRFDTGGGHFLSRRQ